MSMVRMCDVCGRIFPEGEEGSASGTVTRNLRLPNGRMSSEQAQEDRCALCTAGGKPQPRLGIESSLNGE